MNKRWRTLLLILSFRQRPNEGNKEYTIGKVTTESGQNPAEAIDREVREFRAQFDETSALDELLRTGAEQMLQAAIESEVTEFVLCRC